MDGDFSDISIWITVNGCDVVFHRSANTRCGGTGSVDPWHRWYSGRLSISSRELGRDATLVSHKAFGAPMNLAVPVFTNFSADVDLVDNFRCWTVVFWAADT